MKCLITGIGGSIGCHVFAHVMHNTDWDVIGIDSFRHKGMTDRVTHMFEAHPDWQSRLKMVTHDLTAPISPVMTRKIGAVDYVIHLASLSDVHDSIENPVPFVMNNVSLALNVLEYVRAVKPITFLQISTDEVYGPTDGKSFHKEWDPIVPSNPYSASKAAQEAIAISYWRSYAVPLILVNLMNNFGEMQSSAKFPAIVQRKIMHNETVSIHGDPHHPGSRFYIHSRNSADAFLWLLTHTVPRAHQQGHADKPDRYNIVGDKQIDNAKLARMIANAMGKGVHMEFQPFTSARPGHDAHYGLDGAKLTALGWKSPVSLETSMRNVVKWQMERPEWLEPKSGL